MKILNGSTPLIVFLLVDSTNGYEAKTGRTPTMQISKNGGAFATITNNASIAEIGNGWYKATLTATETNTDGPLAIRVNATDSLEWRSLAFVETNVLSDDDMDDIADHVLMRNTATTESSGSGDTIQQYSLINAIRATVGKNVISGSSLNTYEEDESTVAFSRTVATDSSADPVTGLS